LRWSSNFVFSSKKKLNLAFDTYGKEKIFKKCFSLKTVIIRAIKFVPQNNLQLAKIKVIGTGTFKYRNFGLGKRSNLAKLLMVAFVKRSTCPFLRFPTLSNPK